MFHCFKNLSEHIHYNKISLPRLPGWGREGMGALIIARRYIFCLRQQIYNTVKYNFREDVYPVKQQSKFKCYQAAHPRHIPNV